jgi:hypothetical protein
MKNVQTSNAVCFWQATAITAVIVVLATDNTRGIDTSGAPTTIPADAIVDNTCGSQFSVMIGAIIVDDTRGIDTSGALTIVPANAIVDNTCGS